jgi:PIN domain nuclease of toxin-antitoxin system
VIYLLDTHAFLWWLADSPKLGRKARAALADRNSSVLVSAASIWEMAIKSSLGKLRMRKMDAHKLAELPKRCGFGELPISAAHAATVNDLAFHHHDPFDRMLVAQALVDNLVIVTADDTLGKYAPRTLDAGA